MRFYCVPRFPTCWGWPPLSSFQFSLFGCGILSRVVWGSLSSTLFGGGYILVLHLTVRLERAPFSSVMPTTSSQITSSQLLGLTTYLLVQCGSFWLIFRKRKRFQLKGIMSPSKFVFCFSSYLFILTMKGTLLDRSVSALLQVATIAVPRG